MEAARINHIWGTDITYIRLKDGFVYLVAFLDWFSRYVLSWRISNTLDIEFVLEAGEEVYLKSYENVTEAVSGIENFIQFYNHKRPHQSLGYKTPADIYFNERNGS